MAAFATSEGSGIERLPNHELRLAALKGAKLGTSSKSGSALASPADGIMLRTSITATFLKDVEVDPDEESISSVNPRGSVNTRIGGSSLLRRATGRACGGSGRGGGAGGAAGSAGPLTAESAAALYEQDLQGFEEEEEEEEEEDGDDDALSLSAASSAVDVPTDPCSLAVHASAAAVAAGRVSAAGGVSEAGGAVRMEEYGATVAALANANAQLADLRAQLAEANAKKRSSGADPAAVTEGGGAAVGAAATPAAATPAAAAAAASTAARRGSFGAMGGSPPPPPPLLSSSSSSHTASLSALMADKEGT